MYRLWEPIVRPLFDLLRPQVIVEVGSDLGYGTKNLLDYCRRYGAVLHAVDPLPKFDVAEWMKNFPDAFVFHPTTSLKALPVIERPDVVLIDGDHNWHTVFHELMTLELTTREHGTSFPLVLLHDVGWPYGRRDLYYEPERIPEPHRHPHKKGGLRPGRRDLDPDGGLNTHLYNAVTEGGPRNGVLTAVENFIEERSTEFDLVVVPGLHGLGVVLPTPMRTSHPDLAGFIDELGESSVLQRLLGAFEESRLESLIEALDWKREAKEAQQLAAGQQTKIEQAERELRIRVGSLQQERDQTRALVNRVRTELNARTRDLKSRDRELDIRTEALRNRNQELRERNRELRDIDRELSTRTRALESRNRDVSLKQKQIRALEKKLESLSQERQRIAMEHKRLKSRRSVRIALGLAALARPLFRLRRRSSKSEPSGSSRSETPAEHGSADVLEEAGPEGSAGSQHGPTKVRPTPVEEPSPDSEEEPNGSEEESADDTADIVVCIHNAKDDVERCLDSIVANSDLSRHSLILVDDGSDDLLRQVLVEFASRHPARLIRNDELRGFTKAANQGIMASTSAFVVLLNADTVVGPRWLDKLIECAVTMPDAAMVGPLSNAASWQSVPEWTSPYGTWHLSPLPEGVSVEERGQSIERLSPRLYPEVPLVNGFCYLISRAALRQVGPLDEENFPRGFGEEGDFSIRSAEAGFKLYIADDCYIHHAKFRSSNPEVRRDIVRTSEENLNRKYGADRLKERVAAIRAAEDLIRSRTFVSEALKRERLHLVPPALGETSPTVAWIQPHFEDVGGVRRSIEMTNRLNRWGFRTVLISPEGRGAEWLPIDSDVVPVERARSMSFDILIASNPEVVWPFLEIEAQHKINYHLAAYMLYRQVNETLRAYYDASDPQIVHVANSKWTAEQAHSFADISIQGVFPGGVDKGVFRPMRVERTHDVVSSGSTRRHKGGEIIDVAVSSDLSHLKMHAQQASRDQLPALINSGRVYASACWHEGFNLSVLEAMACGVPVVITNDGGSTEYAVDGENSLVVESRDPDALREQILRTLGDKELRARLIENGLRTAWSYDWDTVTVEFARFLVGTLDK